MGAKRTENPFVKETLEVHMRNSKQQKHVQTPKGIYGSKADRNSFRGGNSGSAHAELKTAKARTEPERNLWEQSGQKILSWGKLRKCTSGTQNSKSTYRARKEFMRAKRTEIPFVKETLEVH